MVSAPGNNLESLSVVPGVAVHRIPMRREPSLGSDLKALFEWTRLLRRVRPTVMSVGTPKAALLAMIAGALVRIPRRIYLLRGLRLETTSGAHRGIYRSLETMTALCSHKVLAVSASLRREAIRLKIAPAAKVQLLGLGSSNGVQVEHFDPSHFDRDEISDLRAKLKLRADVPVLGFVGRLNKDKGLQVLADARDLLIEAELDHQLLVVGEADGDSDEAIRRLLECGRAAAVTGHVADPAMYYQLMSVLCLPTLREGFPNVVLEAGAAGIPTVTTDATGAQDSVVHEETGLIAEVGSAASLASALTKVLGDDEMRGEMGRRASAWVNEHFRRESVHKRLQEYYLEQVASARTRLSTWNRSRLK
ncbi:glycosyltransferase family 4 protein [Paramicrobacterium humi]|uniref:glycosyltransferase family 4 protein n=1 Tax=Paramicrobacterium humi TaxID=640635 RepID=UPI0015A23F11